jgi:predicted ATPase
MPSDRITQLSIEGMRCIESIDLSLKDFTVLIGENGSGKSTIIEALEILRKAAMESPLIGKIYERHDGTRLVRQGTTTMRIGVSIDGDGPPLTYAIRILRDSSYLSVNAEMVGERSQRAGSGIIMWRTGPAFSVFESDGTTVVKEGTASPDETVITHARFLKVPQLERVQRALAAIELHPTLDLRRTWSNPQASQTARSSNLVRPADRLEPGGTNLVNVYAALRNQRNWRETVGRLQVALGDIDDVLFINEATGGTQTIGLRWRNGLEVLLSELSDGQVAVLALVAIQQLKRARPPSLVAIDEPEVHLHPGLIARVAVGLQEMAEEVPVLVGTQSDAFLNAIERPHDSVVLCQLDEQRRTALHRPDREQLEAWLSEFQGLGAMRSEGLQSAVFPASP